MPHKGFVDIQVNGWMGIDFSDAAACVVGVCEAVPELVGVMDAVDEGEAAA